ncbi:MAG: hypothetical protein E6686_06305 [Lachnospiraceae bacterium]|nr:hypothetical protein [Lachnospiraceae bacterium]
MRNNAFATPHSKNPAKSSIRSSQNIHYKVYDEFEKHIDFLI